MYNVQCTMYNVQCTMYNVQCTMYIVQCTLYNFQDGNRLFKFGLCKTSHCSSHSLKGVTFNRLTIGLSFVLMWR